MVATCVTRIAGSSHSQYAPLQCRKRSYHVWQLVRCLTTTTKKHSPKSLFKKVIISCREVLAAISSTERLLKSHWNQLDLRSLAVHRTAAAVSFAFSLLGEAGCLAVMWQSLRHRKAGFKEYTELLFKQKLPAFPKRV